MRALVVLICGVLIANTAMAAKGKSKKAHVAKSKPRIGANLQTDVKFDNSIVHGKYQMADEVSVRIENEKVLSDLLAVRPHFKDRLLQASGQE